MDIRVQINPKLVAKLDRMSPGFMVPVIEYGDAWIIETKHGGSFIVPARVEGIDEHAKDGQVYTSASIHGHEHAPCLSVFEDYMPEGVSGNIESATVRRGVFLARMSAPGYMDCTEWELHESADEAARSLIENYFDGE